MTIAELTAELNTTKGQLTAAQGNVTALQGEKTELQGKLTLTEGKVSALEGEKVTLTGQVSTLTGEIGTLKGQVTTLTNEQRSATELAASHGAEPVKQDKGSTQIDQKSGKELYDQYSQLDGRAASEFWNKNEAGLMSYADSLNK